MGGCPDALADVRQSTKVKAEYAQYCVSISCACTLWEGGSAAALSNMGYLLESHLGVTTLRMYSAYGWLDDSTDSLNSVC